MWDGDKIQESCASYLDNKVSNLLIAKSNCSRTLERGRTEK